MLSFVLNMHSFQTGCVLFDGRRFRIEQIMHFFAFNR